MRKNCITLVAALALTACSSPPPANLSFDPETPNPHDAYTTPRLVDLNGDGTPDVVMGGREGSFGAFDGKTGAVLWHTDPSAVAKTKDLLYFSTPAVIPDANGDGVSDLLVIYGGDALKLPGTPRGRWYLIDRTYGR